MKKKLIRIRGIEPRAAAAISVRGGNVNRYTISDIKFDDLKDILDLVDPLCLTASHVLHAQFISVCATLFYTSPSERWIAVM